MRRREPIALLGGDPRGLLVVPVAAEGLR